MAKQLSAFPKLIRRLTAGLFASVLSLQGAQAADHAVIVGVNTYPFIPNGDLRQARADALKFRDFIKSTMGFTDSQITLLLDKDATGLAVKNAVEQKLLRETNPGDRVVFYFSGHGDRIQDTTGDENTDGKDEVLVLSNAGSGQPSLIPDDVMGAWFESIPDREVLVVVDSCFSGTITRGSAEETTSDERARTLLFEDAQAIVEASQPIVRATQALRPEAALSNGDAETLIPGQEHMTVWSAVTQTQVALEDRRGGVFTRAFIEGMSNSAADYNGNGVVSNSELLRFTRAESRSFCNRSQLCRDRNNGQLTPVFSGRVETPAAFSTPLAPAPTPAPSTPALEPAPQPQPAPAAPTAPAVPAVPALPAVTQPPAAPQTLNQPGVLTDLFVPNNTAGLSLSITPSPQLRLGDIVKFTIGAQRGGTLRVFDYNPDGDLLQLYPSALSQSTAGVIAAGEIKTVPSVLGRNNAPLVIRVTEPAGSGHLIALLIEDDVAGLETLLPAGVNSAPTQNATLHLYQIAELLNRTVTENDVTRPIRWSSVVMPYTISR